jgi:putative oxidoreductase
MNILQWLSQTDSGVEGLILRIVLAVVMFPHGAQKTLGWFGGHGFRGTMKFLTSSGIRTGTVTRKARDSNTTCLCWVSQSL